MVRLVVSKTSLGLISYAILVFFVMFLFFVSQKEDALQGGEYGPRLLERHVRGSEDNMATQKSSVVAPQERYDYRSIQADRKARMRQTCSAMGYDPTYNVSEQLDRTLLKQMDFILAIPELKLIFCYVPKVSCTSWKRLLLTLIGYRCFMNESCEEDAHMLARKRFTRLSKLSVEAAKNIFATYTPFFFVRNPYSRVLSAYLEKVLYHPESKIQNHMVEWFDEHYQNLHPNRSEPFSYREFIRHYMEAEKNQHWEDMHKLCLPCHVNYQFIGNYETLKQDADFILDFVDAAEDIHFPSQQKPPTYSSDEETLKNFYSQLSDTDLEQLSVSKGFATDVTMFGYQIPDCIRRK